MFNRQAAMTRRFAKGYNPIPMKSGGGEIRMFLNPIGVTLFAEQRIESTRVRRNEAASSTAAWNIKKSKQG